MPFFGRDRTLFRVFGIPIKANLSWLFLVTLVVISLAKGLFPRLAEGQAAHVYWLLAVAGAVGLFASLIVHELCHSLVARSMGTPVTGITLFIFGGVSQLGEEPPTAPAEFLMAVAGPLSSLILGGVFLTLTIAGMALGWSRATLALLRCLVGVNFGLAAFNSLPAFPLDGGRVVRSILWAVTDDLRVATNIAANIGAFFGLGLMVLGGFLLFQGLPFHGMWGLVLGFFLRQAAMGSLRMVLLRQRLEGEKVCNFMTTDVVTVPQNLDLQQFVDRYVFHHRFSYYPVVDDAGRLAGLVSARAPREVDSRDWPATTVDSVMVQLDDAMRLKPETDAVDALSLLRQREESRAVVVQDGRPVGIVSLRDLVHFLGLKMDLEPRSRRR